MYTLDLKHQGSPGSCRSFKTATNRPVHIYKLTCGQATALGCLFPYTSHHNDSAGEPGERPAVARESSGCAQAYVAKARVESFSLVADLMYVASNAPRICRALFEITLRRGWPQAAEHILDLCKVGTVTETVELGL